MNRAEHSPPNPSAPHGASQAVIFSVSPTFSRAHGAVKPGFPSSDAPVFGPQGPQGEIPAILQLLSRRRAFSGRALVAVLALGLCAGHAPCAQATPSFRFFALPASPASPKVATPKVATSNASRAPQFQAAGSAATSMIARRAAFSSAPRVGLMPRAVKTTLATKKTANAPSFPVAFSALKMAQSFQREMARLSAKASAPVATPVTTKKRVASAPRLAKWTASTIGGGKMIRIAEVAPAAPQIVRPRFRAISTPFAPLSPAKIKPAVPDLGGMKKVIDASSLSLPPLSQPLPTWMQSAAVKIDRLGAKTPKRFAQNPSAAPVRNPAAPVTNSDRLANQIEVAVSTFVVLLTTTDLQTVAVADPGIADVAVVNSRSVLLNGKASGVTSLVIVDGQKIRQYTVRVTATPGSRPVDIAGAIGIPGVTVRPLKDALVLEGEVASAEEARRATEIAGIYSAKVLNQLSIRGQVSAAAGTAAQLSELIGLPSVSVRVSGDTAILTGVVETPQQIQDADVIARTAAKNVINQLRLPPLSPEQVRQALGAVPDAPVAGLFVPGQLQLSAPLSVREAGGQLVLEGTVANQSDVDIALAAAARTGLPLINRIQVRAAATPDQALASQVAAAIGRPGVIVRGTAKRLILEGTVNDTNEAVLAEQVARAFTIPVVGQVDNMLRTANPLQCNVDVSIMEINSTDARNLGVEFGSATLLSENFNAGTPAVTNPVTGVVTPGTPAGTTRTIDPAFRPGVGLVGRRFAGLGATQILDPFLARINALATLGKARILSNPRTTVLSGRTATFQVGGQVPIPSGSTTNAAGTSTTIVFKDYGILLDIVPNALRNGNMTLRVRTEVSQPDFGVAVTPPGGGGPIPGFSRRSTITEVTVPAGGVVALSGLISADQSVTTTSIPILSKIPIIGSLFKSRNFRNNQSELVIFVRPRVLDNPLTLNSDAYAGVVAVGENSNAAAQMGNPGLRTFDSGNSISSPTQANQ